MDEGLHSFFLIEDAIERVSGQVVKALPGKR